MLKTLYGKLAAVLFALLALIGLFNILLTLVTSQLYLQEVNQRLHRTLAEHLVSEQPLIKEGEVNEGALQEMFHMLMVINPSIEIYLLDPFGTILAFSAPPGKVKRHRVSLQPIRRFLRHPDRLPILGDDPRSLRRQKIFSVAPVKREGRLEGYLYVVLGGEEYDSIARRLQG
ncbi:MAG: sensor histidine kinase, partial [Nitrospinota bacterium]